jgi:hypothetical protein
MVFSAFIEVGTGGKIKRFNLSQTTFCWTLPLQNLALNLGLLNVEDEVS